MRVAQINSWKVHSANQVFGNTHQFLQLMLFLDKQWCKHADICNGTD